MFYGVSSTELGQIHLVFELMEVGSLAALLESDTVLDWGLRQQFALELAHGMQHLHGMGMIHRDLKSDNCLISADMHAKVSDLGHPLPIVTCPSPRFTVLTITIHRTVWCVL